MGIGKGEKIVEKEEKEKNNGKRIRKKEKWKKDKGRGNKM